METGSKEMMIIVTSVMVVCMQNRTRLYLKLRWAVSIHESCNLIVKSKAFNVVISETIVTVINCTLLEVFHTHCWIFSTNRPNSALQFTLSPYFHHCHFRYA